MLSSNLEKTLRDAYQLATNNKHEFVTLEHLLYSLINDKDALSVLNACGIDIILLQNFLDEFIQKELTNLKENMCNNPCIGSNQQELPLGPEPNPYAINNIPILISSFIFGNIIVILFVFLFNFI